MGAKWGEIQERRLSLSRVEEVMGWLGRRQQDPSERGFDQWRDEPADHEEREAQR